MIQALKKSAYTHGYLVITAAWLFTLSFIFTNYWSYTSSPNRVQKRFESFIQESEETFDRVSKDTAAIRSVIADTAKPSIEAFKDIENQSFYIYTQNDIGNYLLRYWSSHVVIPQQDDLQRKDGKYFVKYFNGQFELIKRTITLNGQQVLIAGMIPIRWNYFWNNKYLQNEFAAFKELGNRYQMDTTNTGFAIRSSDGKVLFRLIEKQKEKILFSEHDWVPLTFRIVAIIFILIFFNFVAFDIVKQQGWLKGFGLLILIIVLIRSLSYLFAFPFNFRRFELFDPLIYASNDLHPSLGDLLINNILLFWIVSFLKYVSVEPIRLMRSVKDIKGRGIALLSSFVLVIACFWFTEVIQSLIVDSQISFDVADFLKLNVFTLLSFIILCFIVLSFFNLSHIIMLLIKKCECDEWLKYVFVAVLGLVFLSINFDKPTLPTNLVVLGWLLLYLLLLDNRKKDLYQPLMKSSFSLLWLIIFAASISTLIIFENRTVELELRKKIAEKLAMQTDPSGESLMSVAVTYFNNNFLSSNFHRFKNENSNKIIKDSLIGENFSGYLNKYDTRIYTYDASQRPLFNEDSASYEVIINIIDNQSKKTNIPNLYYYENSLERFSYLFQKEITDADGTIIGYFFVVAKPKRYKSDALYPELFKQVKDISTDLNVNYAYAVYNNGKILENYGDYNFKSKLAKDDIPKVEYEIRDSEDNNELWYKAGYNKTIVIIRKGTVFYEAITLFAYLFGAFLFIVLLFHAGSLLFRSRFQWRSIKFVFKLSIRSQIHSTIIFISIFSFVIIGAATISFYINRFNKSNRERLVRAISIMADEIQNQVAAHAIFDDVVKIYDLGANSEFESSISEVSEIHSVDVNFYDLGGALKFSTQPYIYNKHILSQMMHPKAYYGLHYNNEIQVIQDENVGKFNYVSIYVPIRDESGHPYAYLNIPYLNSQSELNQEILNFLVTLINLNAFIFVLSGIIALLLTNRITSSFSLIAEKMKAINLGKFNEQIVWNVNDEIGALVIEYNKMVKKLEESAEALAKSEREGAWREMARQVAHEIKNPLTPMKLSIQYLQKAIHEQKPNVQELAKKVSATLIEQIDALSKIASDFSQFANIGNVKTEVFDPGTVINSLINLHSSNEGVEIIWEQLDSPVFIDADKNQVNRLFTNLLLNAIDASADKEKAYITIKQEIVDEQLLISVKDEGCGIPEDKRSKIFIPNFTTKTSGTGLGLAICKGIVEKANGAIWFITKENEGTTFYVRLPLVNP